MPFIVSGIALGADRDELARADRLVDQADRTLARHGQRGFFRFRSNLAPIRRSQSVDHRRVIVRSNILIQPISLVDGYVQLVAGGIRHLQVFVFDAFQRELNQDLKDADAVIDVHHVIAGL